MLAPFDPDLPNASQLNARDGQQLTGRRFLIVTAPFGRFARVLARVLREQGADASRMIFNLADHANWRDSDAIVFKTSVRSWPERLRELSRDFTDILVFGEGGGYNQGVLSQSRQLGCNVWVLENGYFRPDWITVERNGVNGSSGLPRSAEGYCDPAPPLPVTRPVGRILPHHVINISLYHAIEPFGRGFFPMYEHPYLVSPARQFWGHVRRYLSLAFQRGLDCDAQALRAHGPFFIACLQREGDVQLLRYSHYANNMAFLAEVMGSFAQHARPDHRLVVKNHPLDPGLSNLAHLTHCLAVERGIADRVDFIDGGNLAQLCRASQGMVVNNSSAALSALGFQTPVKVLGDAFFDFEGLTDQKPMDDFWKSPSGPDPELFKRFRAHVIASSQVNGNYHEPRAMRRTAMGVAEVFALRA